MRLDRATYAELVAKGKIKPLGNPDTGKKRVIPKQRKPDRDRKRVFDKVTLAALNCGIEPPVREYKFCPDRRWRSDLAWPDLKILVEYEGIVSEKSRHTSLIGYTKDREKYNAAQILGFTVLCFTALTPESVIFDQVSAAIRKNGQRVASKTPRESTGIVPGSTNGPFSDTVDAIPGSENSKTGRKA